MLKSEMPTVLNFDLDVFLDEEPGYMMPKNIGICLAGDVDFDLAKFTLKENIDLWIAVDGGYDHLKKYLINPEVLIGDMDSIDTEEVTCEVLQYDSIKDETDFVLALNYIEENYVDSNIHVVGIASKVRLEHLYANIKSLRDKMTLYTKYNKIIKLRKNQTLSRENNQYFSLFTPSRVMGLSIVGSKYDINLVDMDNDNTLGISNEFVNDTITVSFNNGEVIAFLSNEDGYYE